jgi:hypothetical protein
MNHNLCCLLDTGIFNRVVDSIGQLGNSLGSCLIGGCQKIKGQLVGSFQFSGCHYFCCGILNLLFCPFF